MNHVLGSVEPRNIPLGWLSLSSKSLCCLRLPELGNVATYELICRITNMMKFPIKCFMNLLKDHSVKIKELSIKNLLESFD